MRKRVAGIARRSILPAVTPANRAPAQTIDQFNTRLFFVIRPIGRSVRRELFMPIRQMVGLTPQGCIDCKTLTRLKCR